MKSSDQCTLLGIVDDGWDGLSDRARCALLAADLVIAAARTLALVAPQLPESTRLMEMDGALASVAGWIAAAREQGRSVVVLASGDPLCHGIAGWLSAQLGPEAFTIIPTVSTLQLAFARLRTPWADVRIASCHGADAGEWYAGATPAHALYPVLQAIALHRRVAVFTGPQNNPARLARALIGAGYGEAKLSVACRLLLPDETIHRRLAASDAARLDFAEPNVVLVERDDDRGSPAFGRDDRDYCQRSPDKGLISKQEARALALAKLRLAPAAIVWDIGAGSGAVGLECARLAPLGHVWAIEKNAADAANARANAARFRVVNYSLSEGRAPQQLDSWPDPDAVFIGGSGGELATLIRLCLDRLKPGGRLVMNFATLENLATASATLKECAVAWDLVQLQASRSQPILDMHRLAAENPVWIVSATKEST